MATFIYNINDNEVFFDIISSTLIVKKRQVYIYSVVSLFAICILGLFFATLSIHFVLPFLGITDDNLNFREFVLWGSDWSHDYLHIMFVYDKHHVYYYYFVFIGVFFFITALKNYKDFIEFIDKKDFNEKNIDSITSHLAMVKPKKRMSLKDLLIGTILFVLILWYFFELCRYSR